MPDEPNSNDGAVDVDLADLEERTFTKTEVNAIVKQRLARERGRGQRTNTAGEGSRLDRLEQVVEKLAGAAAPPEYKPAAAAAPRPPAMVNPFTSGGLVDIFNLPLDQVMQLGPSDLREHHEKALAVARSQSGAPPIPKLNKR